MCRLIRTWTLNCDVRARASGKRATQIRRVGDDGAAVAAGFEERNDGLDLWAHAAAWEMPFLEQALGFRQFDAVQPPLIRTIEVHGDLFHAGRNYEQVGLQLARQQSGCEVLVDDRLKPLQSAVRILNDRNSSTTAGNDDMTIVDERVDDVLLDDALWLRRPDNAPPAPAGILLHDPAEFRCQAVCRVLVHVPANRLGRIGQG